MIFVLGNIGIPPIHQFFLDVKEMRLTATDPTDGGDLMGFNGAGPVLNGGRGRL
jgi:hypothetical protein